MSHVSSDNITCPLSSLYTNLTTNTIIIQCLLKINHYKKWRENIACQVAIGALRTAKQTVCVVITYWMWSAHHKTSCLRYKKNTGMWSAHLDDGGGGESSWLGGGPVGGGGVCVCVCIGIGISISGGSVSGGRGGGLAVGGGASSVGTSCRVREG